jgi:hypothetical protein
MIIALRWQRQKDCELKARPYCTASSRPAFGLHSWTLSKERKRKKKRNLFLPEVKC